MSPSAEGSTESSNQRSAEVSCGDPSADLAGWAPHEHKPTASASSIKYKGDAVEQQAMTRMTAVLHGISKKQRASAELRFSATLPHREVTKPVNLGA